MIREKREKYDNPIRSGNLPVPALGEHAIITGQTGSGKTETACQLLSALSSQVIVFDTKGEERFEYLPASIYTKAGSFLKDGNSQYIIYRPQREEAEPEILDSNIDKLFNQKRNCYLYIDEAYQVSPVSKPMRGLGNAIMRGRKRWDGNKTTRLSVITGSQRPVWIPKHCFTEARHYYVHSLSEDDIDTISDYIGQYNKMLTYHPPRGHEFYYYEAAANDGVNYQPRKYIFNLDEKPKLENVA